MSLLNLSLAFGNYDRTRALVDGSVQIDGVNPIVQLLSPEEMFFRAFRHQAFDVSELSFSSYVVSLTRENAPYIAIPVSCHVHFATRRCTSATTRALTNPKISKGAESVLPNIN